MASKKKLSIGITVNLENYENIRLEVDGEVESRGDAEALVAYLDDVLAGMGRSDPATARKIDSYRSRVLSIPGISREVEPAGVIEEEVAIPAEKEEEVLIAEQPVSPKNSTTPPPTPPAWARTPTMPESGSPPRFPR
jgi:hypothetical protein